MSSTVDNNNSLATALLVASKSHSTSIAKTPISLQLSGTTSPASISEPASVVSIGQAPQQSLGLYTQAGLKTTEFLLPENLIKLNSDPNPDSSNASSLATISKNDKTDTENEQTIAEAAYSSGINRAHTYDNNINDISKKDEATLSQITLKTRAFPLTEPGTKSTSEFEKPDKSNPRIVTTESAKPIATPDTSAKNLDIKPANENNNIASNQNNTLELTRRSDPLPDKTSTAQKTEPELVKPPKEASDNSTSEPAKTLTPEPILPRPVKAPATQKSALVIMAPKADNISKANFSEEPVVPQKTASTTSSTPTTPEKEIASALSNKVTNEPNKATWEKPALSPSIVTNTPKSETSKTTQDALSATPTNNRDSNIKSNPLPVKPVIVSTTTLTPVTTPPEALPSTQDQNLVSEPVKTELAAPIATPVKLTADPKSPSQSAANGGNKSHDTGSNSIDNTNPVPHTTKVSTPNLGKINPDFSIY